MDTGNIIEKYSLLTVGRISKIASTTSLLTARDSAITVRNEAIQLSILKWVSKKSQPDTHANNCVCEIGEECKPIFVITAFESIAEKESYIPLVQKTHELSKGFFVMRGRYE